MIKTTNKINKILIMGLLLTLISACAVVENKRALSENKKSSAEKRPNIVLIFADDLGYGDISAYGAKGINTPNIDSIGADGFTSRDFFVPSNVCSPSRASLLTGRYPSRVGIPVALNPLSTKHLQANYRFRQDEITIPEMIKSAGYRSLMVGKWHLGLFEKGSHPLDAGFDEHLGLRGNYYKVNKNDPKYPYVKNDNTLYRGKTAIEENVNLEQLTKRYTDEVIQFIDKESQKAEPFFVYFAHHIAHSPHKPRSQFIGSSKKGKYGDFIHELNYSTGRILQKLKELKIDDNTLVIFTSDNGANFQGSNGDLNGGKYTTMEGGHRVPALFKWPKQIPSGLDSNTTISSMDIFPLIAKITGSSLPKDRVIDGKNILSVLQGKQVQSPHEVLYYYNGINLQAVRKGKWKLHLPRTVEDQPFWHKNSAGSRVLTVLATPVLFDLENDRAERTNLADEYPEIVASFQPYINKARAELGDVDRLGSDQKQPPFNDVQNIDRWWIKNN